MAFPRHQSVADAVNGKIYLATGSAPGEQATGNNQEFDPATGTWRDLAPMPGIATHAGGAAIGGKLYVVGGFTGNPHAGAMDTVHEYDVATDIWRIATRLSSPRGSSGVVALNGRLHVVGGRGPDSQTIATHEIYDPASDRWTTAAPLPLARDHLGIATDGSRIFVFGGRTDGIETGVGRLDIYDPASNAWSESRAMPTPRSGGTAFHIDGLIVYYGGECRTDPDRTFDETEAYDIARNEWVTLPSPPHGIHGAPTVTIGDVAYLMGGSIGCGSGDERSTDVYSFRRP
jgi:N-acetylneuraminic acid mutarotase